MQDPRQPHKQRRSLVATLLIVLVLLAVSVSLLIGSVDDLLPDVPGLDYRLVQGGLILLVLGLCAYTLDRERGIKRLERKLFEEQLEVERLRTHDEVKNAFMRSVSHDLRSPLTAILSGAAILEGRGEQMTAEKLREAASIVRSQARRLEGMLSDLLDVERLAAGEIEPRIEDVDLGKVTHTAVDGYGIRNHPIDVSVPDLTARIDRSMFERILENLVRNATKYTPPGTPIRVLVAKEDSDVVLTVEDEGPGVPDDLKESIFEPFNRGNASDGIMGTGIGLSLVAQFARLHGGRAWVEDLPGGGARFIVRLAVHDS